MAERQAHDGDADLALLDAELRRLTRRADRQRRRIRQSTEAWRRWSATIEEGLALVAQIEQVPASDLAGLTTKYRAILWRVHADEAAIMDEAVRRALKRFGRELTAVARWGERARPR